VQAVLISSDHWRIQRHPRRHADDRRSPAPGTCSSYEIARPGRDHVEQPLVVGRTKRRPTSPAARAERHGCGTTGAPSRPSDQLAHVLAMCSALWTTEGLPVAQQRLDVRGA
jgi:hypothetical protein